MYIPRTFTLLKKGNLCSQTLKTLSTWSRLANTFNGFAENSLKFSFVKRNVGLFEINCLSNADGFHLMKHAATCKSDELLQEALSSSRKRKMVTIFDNLSDTLCQVADLAEFLRIAHPEYSFAQAAEEASFGISGLVEKLNTNHELYQKLSDVIINGDVFPTDEIDNHVASLFLFDFEQSGIHLNESKRRKFVQLNEHILQLGAYFMNGSQQVKSVHRSKISKEIVHLFPRDGENLLVNGLFGDCHNEEAREAAYRIYLSEDKRQNDLLNNLLACRHEMAELCGFPSYNHRAIRGSIAETPDVVNEFLDQLSVSLKHSASDEFDEMRKMKKEISEKPLMPWDVPYYVSYLKYNKYKIEGSNFSPYFSIGACMEGLSNLFNSLYGITLEVDTPGHGEVWYSDVHKLAVKHETEGILGYIYCDFFERAGKPAHDCHFTIKGGKLLDDGSYQLPIVVLLLNFPSPSLSKPSLLSPSMVENLFHEVGHAMHSMLARTKYQHVTGTRCSTDFAEVPSVLMEYFANDPRVLSTFARHYSTGEKIPEDMLQQLCASKKMFLAADMQLQIFYSILDQRLHSSGNYKVPTIDILEKAQNEYYSLPYVPGTCWHLTFGHLVGYGAKYYSYLISKAVASWIWQSNFQSDPFNREMGEKYRREVLAHGGGKPPKKLIQDYLKKTVNPSNLVSFLMNDVMNRQS